MRRGLTYPNLVATLALFLALGGGAVYAAGHVGADKANGVVVKPISIALTEETSADLRRIVRGGGSVAKVTCEESLPQLVFHQGDPAKAFLSIALYKNGANPLIHKAASGVDVLPHNGDPADVEVTLRQANGVTKQARFSYDYRPDALGTHRTCFYQGTLTTLQG